MSRELTIAMAIWMGGTLSMLIIITMALCRLVEIMEKRR
jgi:hypothetical protein